MNNFERTPRRKRRGFMLLVLVLVFSAPSFIAWYLYHHHSDWFTHRVNNGELLLTPLQFADLSLQCDQKEIKEIQGKWLLLYIVPSPCNPLCVGNLYKLRQIRLGMGKEKNRIERVIVTFPSNYSDSYLNSVLKRKYLGTLHFSVNKNQLRRFFQTFPQDNKVLDKGMIFIIDPHGNMILSYSPDADMNDIWKDLTRLLKYSQIG